MAFKVSGSGLNKLPEEASSRKSPGKGKSQLRETAVFDQTSAGGTLQRKLLSPTQKKLANVGTSHSSDSTTLRDALRAEDALEDFEGSSSHHIPQTKTVDPFITKQSVRGEQPGIQASKIPTLKQAKRGPSSSHTSHGAEQQTSKHGYEEVLPMPPFTETTHEIHTTKKAPKPPYVPNLLEVREDRHDREADGSRSGKAVATMEAPVSKIPSLKQVKRALPANASSNVVDVSAHNQKLQGSELSIQGLKEVSRTESDLPQAESSTHRCESKLPEITDAGKRQVDIKGIYEAMEAVSVGIKKGSNHVLGTGTDHWETLKVGESSFKPSGPSLHGSSRSDSAEFVVEELSYDSESVYQLTKGDPLCLTESANPSDDRCILDQDKDCLWESSLPATSSQSPISIGDNSFATDSNSLKNSSSANISEVFISNNKSMAATNSGNGKPSQRGETLESRKSSLSRASDSSGISDESTWSNITGSINKPHKANDPRWEAIIVIRKRDGNLGLSHFRLLKRLGCGDIGSVYLAELSGTRCFFAMKVMDKASLASRKKLLRAQTEREILQSLDHPFLPTLYTHFETEKFSCLVMEFCPGGDLHTLRQRQPGKHFSELAARFYAAEVLLALEYLHMLGIVYRDLKPENVLVREDGHIMLSDFDLSLRCAVNPTLVKSSLELDPSKKGQAYCVQPACIEPSCTQPVCVQPSCVQPSCFVPRLFHQKSKKGRKAKVDIANQVTPLPELMAEPTNARSMSFVGTHEYLAPEIIKGEGHGSAVDWWTFGIFLHELIFGKTPFKGSGNRATLFNVVGQPLRFPDSPHASFAARDLIRGLLVKEPQHRLAYKRGATEIKQHPFFEGVNWALIRCTTPPDIPKPFEIELPKSVSAKASASEKKVAADSTSGNYLDFDFF